MPRPRQSPESQDPAPSLIPPRRLAVIGADGLPHCLWCKDEALCGYHTKQVNAALGSLKTAHLLARDRDVRATLSMRGSKIKETHPLFP